MLPPPENNSSDRDMAAGGCFLDADSKAVGPHDTADWLVCRHLSEKLSETDIRSKKLRIQVQFQTVVQAFVRVERIIPSISIPHDRDSRETRMQILSWNQFGNQ